MRPLTSSVSREELSELLNVPLDVVDALLDSGRVLCHVRGGKPRVPLAQLEEFFRDALLRLYQAESQGVPVEMPVAIAPQPERKPDPEGELEPQPDPEPELQREPELVLSAPAFTTAVPGPEEDTVHDGPEHRVSTRYVPLRQLGGIFGDTKFVVMQVSATGLRIRHNEPLMPGDEAKVSFALMRPARSIVVRARVVWTSLAKAGEEQFSISGLRITEHQDRVAVAIESMRAMNELQPERRGRHRRVTDTMAVISGISDEEMALVTAAVQKFASDPVEATRWYSRARFALSDDNVRRAAPERPREREEVLGIWEYLDRQVEIGKIAGVVSWIRTAGAAGAPGPRVSP